MIDSSRFDPEALKLFLEEAGDMEDQIEESLLLLENDPSNRKRSTRLSGASIRSRAVRE